MSDIKNLAVSWRDKAIDYTRDDWFSLSTGFKLFSVAMLSLAASQCHNKSVVEDKRLERRERVELILSQQQAAPAQAPANE